TDKPQELIEWCRTKPVPIKMYKYNLLEQERHVLGRCSCGPGQLRAIRYAIPISWPINGTNGQLPVRAARERRNWTGRPGALLQMDLYDRETHYTRDGITSLPPTMTPLCSTRVSLSLLVVSLLQKIATGGTITCL
ncbi:hypothetical protein J6590_105390, partial [Homalodisca vitripennis]